MMELERFRKLIAFINEYRWGDAYSTTYDVENELEIELLYNFGEPNKLSEHFNKLRLYLSKNIRNDVKSKECRRILSEILSTLTPYGMGTAVTANGKNPANIDVVLESMVERLDKAMLYTIHATSAIPSGITTSELIKIRFEAIEGVRRILNAMRRLVDSIQTDRVEIIETVEKLVRPAINDAISKCVSTLGDSKGKIEKLSTAISHVKEATMKLVMMLRHPERSMIVADSIKEVFNVDITSKTTRTRVEESVKVERVSTTSAKFDWVDEEWELILQHPRIYVIIGHRYSGKSASLHSIGEYIRYKFNVRAYFFNVYDKPVPPHKLALLPDWMDVVSDFDEASKNSVVLVDEAYLKFHARTSMREAPSRVRMDKILELSRQKAMSIIFVTQRTTKLDKNILEAADTYLIKNIHHTQVTYERSPIRKILEDAYNALKNVPVSSKQKYVYVYAETDGFAGLKVIGLPSYWNEELSRFYEDF